MIKTAKHTKKYVSAISTLVAMLVLATTIFASGVLANGLLNDEYKIEVQNGDSLIGFNNKPFMENGEVYLPLRETLTAFGALEHRESKIEWNDGNIILEIACDEKSEGEITGLIYPYMLTIGGTSVYFPPRQHEDGSHMEAIYSFSLSNAPILKNSVTYVPFEFIQRIDKSTLDYLEGLSLTVYNKEGQILYNVANPKLWKDEESGYQFVTRLTDGGMFPSYIARSFTDFRTEERENGETLYLWSSWSDENKSFIHNIQMTEMNGNIAYYMYKHYYFDVEPLKTPLTISQGTDLVEKFAKEFIPNGNKLVWRNEPAYPSLYEEGHVESWLAAKGDGVDYLIMVDLDNGFVKRFSDYR